MDLESWKGRVREAGARIASLVRKTPLEHSPVLSERGQANVFIKLESEQLTGSCKARGASNKLSLLVERDSAIYEKGPILASSGNHGLACSYFMQKLGITGRLYVPNVISEAKKTDLKRYMVDVVVCGDDCLVSEISARAAAEKEGRTYISPYNDWEVVAGYGTIGMEILEQLPEVDVVLVSVGGGGLISGIATYIKACKPQVKIIGCQPLNSKVMLESVKAGKIIYQESKDTLSDGTAGGIEEGSFTFGLCRDYVDEWVVVTEEEIAQAVYLMIEHHHKIVEGAAGVAIATYIKEAEKLKGQNVVILACGGNIGVDKLQAVINKYT